MTHTKRLILLLFGLVAFASTAAHADNRRLVHHGRVLRPDGSPLQGNFQMETKIYSPNPSRCLLWGESKQVSFNNGTFTMDIGDPFYRPIGVGGGKSTSFPSVFINNAAYNLAGANCSQGSTYNPQSTDSREMVITLYDGQQIIKVYDDIVRSAPYAIESYNAGMVGGYSSGYIFKFNETGAHKPSLTFSTLGANFLWDLAETTTPNLGGKRLKGLWEPVDPSDAATLKTVQDQIALVTMGSIGGVVRYVGTSADPGGVLNIAGGPITEAGTLAFSFKSQAAGTIFAAPVSSSGTPLFRALDPTDIPGIDVSKITSGTLSVSRGGTGLQSFTPYAIMAANMTGSALEQRTCANGEVLEWQTGTGFVCVPRLGGAGGVTQVTAGNGLLGGTITTAGTIAIDVGVTNGQIVAVGAGNKIPASLIPSLDLSTMTGTLGVNLGGTGLTPGASDANKIYGVNAAGTAAEFKTLIAGTGVSINHTSGGIEISSSLAGGTLTNVGLAAPTSVFTIANSPVTGAGTMALSFNSQTAAQVFASPTGSNGVPTFRALAGTDLPVVAGTGINVSITGGSLAISATGSGGTVTSVTASTGLLGGTITGAGTVSVDVGLTDGKIVAVGTGDKIPVALIPNLPTSILTSGTLGANRGGTGVDASAAGNGQILIGNGSGFSLNTLTAGSGISITNTAGSISISSSLAGGTVTNVGLAAPTSVFTISNSPVTGAGTMALSFNSQTAAQVLASPTGASGVPIFRSLAGTDLPVIAGTGVNVSITGGSLAISTTGSGGTVTSITASTGLLGGTITGSGTVSVDVGLTDGKIVAVGTGDKIPVALIPSLSTDILTSGTLGVNRGGTGLVPTSGNANQFYAINATGTDSEFKSIIAGTGVSITHSTGSMVISAAGSGGTVTNVGASVPSYMSVSPGSITSSGTFDFSFNSQGAALVFAAPTGASGAPSFRSLAATDIPSLDASKISSGTLGVDRGGTGIGTLTPNALLLANATGSAVVSSVCSPEQIMVWKLVGGWTCENKSTGAVSRVDLTVPSSIFAVAGGPVTSDGTFNVTLQSQAANTIFAAPTGGSGAPTFRALAASDIPNLDLSKLTSGTLGVDRGGTGLVPVAGDANQLYGINNAGTAAEFKTLTAGTGLSISYSAGSINLSLGTSGVSQWSNNANGVDYSTGSVGIGTTNPSQLFDVNGTMKGSSLILGDGGSTTPSLSFTGSSNTGIYRYAAGGVGFSANGNMVAIASSSGLWVPASNAANLTRIPTGAAAPAYAFNGSFDTGLFAPSAGIVGFSTGGTERMRIDGSGNVGIGTTAPSVALDVTATGTVASAIRIPRDTTAMRPSRGTASELQGMMRYNTTLNKYEVYEGTTGWASLSTDSAGTSQWSNNAAGIHYASGSVGIGRINPGSALDVNGTVKAITVIQNDYNVMDYDTNISKDAYSSWSDTYITSGLNNGGAAKNIILKPSGTGNVGIGTTGPTEKLSVSGSVNLSAMGSQFKAYNEDSVRIKFANWYQSNSDQWGQGQLYNELWYGAINGDAARRIGFYLDTPNAGAPDSTGSAGAHPTNARMYIDTSGVIIPSGSVGIGTTNPSAALEVLGTVKATGFQGNGSGLTGVVASPAGTADGQLQFKSGSSLAASAGLSWDNTNSILTISKANNAAGNLLALQSTATNGYSEMTFKNNSGTSTGWLGYGNASAASHGNMLYLEASGNRNVVIATNSTDRLIVDGSGNVGIGITTPGAGTKLSVNGQIHSKSASETTGSIDWSKGNAVTTTHDCASNITFAHLRDGGNYTLVVTGTGTTQCNFATTTSGDDAGTVTYRFTPANAARQANLHTIYSILRIGNTVYVSWVSGL